MLRHLPRRINATMISPGRSWRMCGNGITSLMGYHTFEKLPWIDAFLNARVCRSLEEISIPANTMMTSLRLENFTFLIHNAAKLKPSLKPSPVRTWGKSSGRPRSPLVTVTPVIVPLVGLKVAMAAAAVCFKIALSQPIGRIDVKGDGHN
jgi:hypothetical protein